MLKCDNILEDRHAVQLRKSKRRMEYIMLREIRGYQQCWILLSEYNSLYQRTVTVPMTALILGASTLVFASLVKLLPVLGPVKSITGLVVFAGVLGVAIFVVKMASNLCQISSNFILESSREMNLRKSILIKQLRPLRTLRLQVGNVFYFDNNIFKYWNVVAQRTADILILLK